MPKTNQSEDRVGKETLSLGDYMKQELEKTPQLTMKEWLDRVSSNKLIKMKRSGAEIIREIRDSQSR